MCLRKIPKSFLARVVENVAQACHLPRESSGTAEQRGALFPGFSLEDTAFISFLCHWLSSVLLVSLKEIEAWLSGTHAVVLQQVINLHVRPACHRLKVLCLEWFMSAVSCRVRLVLRGWWSDGGEGVAGGPVGWWLSDLSNRKTDL